MDPADLLFADSRRIDRYFDQIGGSSSRPKLSGELTIGWNPSLKVHASEQTGKAATSFAKIEAIKRHLEKRSRLRFGHPLETDSDVDFIEENCPATRIEIPPRQPGAEKGKKIVLWACTPTNVERSGTLILMQDFNYPDERATSFQGASTFSVLSALVYNTRKEIDDSILDTKLPHRPHPNPDAQFGTADHPWSLSEYHSVSDYVDDFAKDPAGLLRSWNCLVLSERKINVVYKVREWGRDAAHSWQKTTVFGYPIWIFAA